MPEWYLVILVLGALSALGTLWPPLLFTLPPLSLAVLVPVMSASMGAVRATFPSAPRRPGARLGLRLLTAGLHVIQPLARLCGRLQYGLTPWRWRGAPAVSVPRPGKRTFWTERWQDPDCRLKGFEASLKATGAAVRRGGDYDRWDLEVAGGVLGAARVVMAVEDHGSGTQLVRLRWWPRCSRGALLVTSLFGVLSVEASRAEAWAAGAVLGAVTLLLALRTLLECASASAVILRALGRPETPRG
jgi:hypothetical protein